MANCELLPIRVVTKVVTKVVVQKLSIDFFFLLLNGPFGFRERDGE